MGCLRILSLALLCFASSMLAIWAAEPAPVAYIVGLAAEDDEGFASGSCRRDDQTIEVTDGFFVLVGDVITGGKAKVLIAFLMGTANIIDGARVVDATSKTGQCIVIVTRYPADSLFERLVTSFAPRAQQGTQTTSTYHVDGSVTTREEQVATTWNGLDFVNLPGAMAKISGGTPRPTRPRQSVFSTLPTVDTLSVYDRCHRKPVSG